MPMLMAQAVFSTVVDGGLGVNEKVANPHVEQKSD